jgi:hypothetical protein
MKRIALFVLLAVSVGAQTQTTGIATPKYVLIYTESRDCGGAVIMGLTSLTQLNDAGSNNITTVCGEQSHAEFFSDVKSAQERLNKTMWFTNGFYGARNLTITPANFVGLYAITEIPVSQVKVGTEEKPVTITQKVDKLEWRVKQ